MNAVGTDVGATDRLVVLRWVYGVMGLSASGLGLALLFFSDFLWSALEGGGAHSVARTLYASVLVGIGITCWRGVWNPRSMSGVLAFMASYKAVAVIALVLVSGPPSLSPAWFVIMTWAAVIPVALWGFSQGSR